MVEVVLRGLVYEMRAQSPALLCRVCSLFLLHPRRPANVGSVGGVDVASARTDQSLNLQSILLESHYGMEIESTLNSQVPRCTALASSLPSRSVTEQNASERLCVHLTVWPIAKFPAQVQGGKQPMVAREECRCRIPRGEPKPSRI